MNKIIPVFVVILLGLAAWYFMSSDASENDKTAKAIPVEIIAVFEETLSDSVESLGTAMANEFVDITSNVSEVIAEINFEDGQQVEKGHVIARMAQQEEAAQLAAAKARQSENQRELNRLAGLLKNRAASQREYDERVTLTEITKRQIEEIEARIADRTLRAPFSGVLGIRRLSEGALVQPGQLITTLDDVSSIKLDFTVPSIYINSLTKGTPIEARSLALGETVFRGEVASVNSRIDPITRSVLIRAIIPNEEMILKPGLLMQVVLLKDQRTAKVVPEESIIQRADKHFVLVVKDDNTVEEREIRRGVHMPGMVEVVDGLELGEKVITRGVNMVRAGQKVSIAETWDKIRRPTGSIDSAKPPVSDSPPQGE